MSGTPPPRPERGGPRPPANRAEAYRSRQPAPPLHGPKLEPLPSQQRIVIRITDLPQTEITGFIFGVQGAPNALAIHVRTRNASSSMLEDTAGALAALHGVANERGITAVAAVDRMLYADPVGTLVHRIKSYFAQLEAAIGDRARVRLLMEPADALQKKYGLPKLQAQVDLALQLDQQQFYAKEVFAQPPLLCGTAPDELQACQPGYFAPQQWPMANGAPHFDGHQYAYFLQTAA